MSTPSAFTNGRRASAALSVPSGVNMRRKSWYIVAPLRKAGAGRTAAPFSVTGGRPRAPFGTFRAAARARARARRSAFGRAATASGRMS